MCEYLFYLDFFQLKRKNEKPGLLHLMPPSFPDCGMQLMTHHTNNACVPMMPSSNLATAAEAQKARRVDTQVIAAEISVVWAILTFLDAGVHEDTQ